MQALPSRRMRVGENRGGAGWGGKDDASQKASAGASPAPALIVLQGKLRNRLGAAARVHLAYVGCRPGPVQCVSTNKGHGPTCVVCSL